MKSRQQNKIMITILILAFGMYLIFSGIYEEEYPVAKVCGEPVISSEYSDSVRLSIDQILSDDEFIYVLYGEHKGIVQVFDTNGVYQYTASFYDHLNGAFSIAVYEGALYVRDSVHNIYILRDGKCDSFLEREEASSLLERLNFGLQSQTYRVRLGSIWCVSDGEEYCIVKRPVQAVLYQNDLMFFIPIAIVLLIGLYKPISNFGQKKSAVNR